MSGNPADIRRAPVNVAGLVLEHVEEAVGGVKHVAATGVDDTFGFAGGAGGVEDEQDVFGVHHFWFTAAVLSVHLFVVPNVVASVPGNIVASVPVHQDRFHAGAADGHSLIDYFLYGDVLSPPLVVVGTDDDLTIRIVDAIC